MDQSMDSSTHPSIHGSIHAFMDQSMYLHSSIDLYLVLLLYFSTVINFSAL